MIKSIRDIINIPLRKIIGWLLHFYLVKIEKCSRCPEYYWSCPSCNLWLARDDLLEYGPDPKWTEEFNKEVFNDYDDD